MVSGDRDMGDGHMRGRDGGSLAVPEAGGSGAPPLDPRLLTSRAVGGYIFVLFSPQTCLIHRHR